MHGQIVNDIAVANAAQVDQAHNLGTAVFCAFVIQDDTGAGVGPVASNRLFCPQANKTSALCRVRNDLGGNTVASLYACTPHSLIDVGPIVTAFDGVGFASTRTAAQTLRSGPGPSCRSLHSNVAFVNALGAAGDDVTVTHNLNTTNVLVFVSPTFDPVDTGGGGSAMVYLQAVIDANSITLRSRRDAGAVFLGASPVTYDVMVLAQPGSGAHSAVFPPHRATVAGGGVAIGDLNCDYDGANVGRAQLRTPTASYWAGYSNVDTIAVGPGGKDVVHNLGGAALMALVGQRVTGVQVAAVPFIVARDQVAGTTLRLGRIAGAGDITDADVLIMRSFSRVNRQA